MSGMLQDTGKAPSRLPQPQTGTAEYQERGSACPCGCGGAVKAGNRYASPACWAAILVGQRVSRPASDGTTVDRDSIVQRRSWSQLNNPRTSWWADCDRLEFRRRLLARLPLMPISEFGRGGAALATAPDVMVRRRVSAVEEG